MVDKLKSASHREFAADFDVARESLSIDTYYQSL